MDKERQLDCKERRLALQQHVRSMSIKADGGRAGEGQQQRKKGEKRERKGQGSKAEGGTTDGSKTAGVRAIV